MVNDIKQILSYGQLNPGQAAKLRGRLGFSQSLLFGKMGRALLQPLAQRQYSKRLGRSRPLTEDLSDTLSWWITAIENAPPRSIPYRMAKPSVCYSDACGAGHIAVTIFVDGTRYTPRTHLPAWFMMDGAGIFEAELAAVALGMFLAMIVAPGRPILLCCDNMGASGSVTRGSCATPIGRAFLSSLARCRALFRRFLDRIRQIWPQYSRRAVQNVSAYRQAGGRFRCEHGYYKAVFRCS